MIGGRRNAEEHNSGDIFKMSFGTFELCKIKVNISIHIKLGNDSFCELDKRISANGKKLLSSKRISMAS